MKSQAQPRNQPQYKKGDPVWIIYDMFNAKGENSGPLKGYGQIARLSTAIVKVAVGAVKDRHFMRMKCRGYRVSFVIDDEISRTRKVTLFFTPADMFQTEAAMDKEWKKRAEKWCSRKTPAPAKRFCRRDTPSRLALQ